jgi:HK97 family phage major capsid protein
MTKEELNVVVREVLQEVLGDNQTARDEERKALVAIASSLQQNKATPPLDVQERGLEAARFVRAMAAGKGDVERAMAWAKKQGYDTLVKAMGVSTVAGGGALVPETYATAIIELLRPMSAVRQLNPTIIPMSSGTLTMPAITGGASGSYIGENKNIATTSITTGLVKLSWKKLAAMVPISNDLIRQSSPAADAVVRDDLVAAIAQRSDQAFIRDDGTQETPKGLRYLAPSANVFGAQGSPDLAKVTSDLAKAIMKLKSGNSRMLRPGWLMSPRTELYLMAQRDGNGNFAWRDEMLAGKLWRYPYATTTLIPDNLGGGSNESEVYLADFADVIIGESTNLLIDVSTEAAYYDSTLGAVVSAFSQDQTVVRAIVEHDINMRHLESVAVITTVLWALA